MAATDRTIPLRAITIALAALVLTFAAAAAVRASPAAAHPCAHAHANPKAAGTAQASRAVVCLLNKRRQDHGLSSLRANRDLRHAAGYHSRQMDGHGCFDHVCPGEPGIVSRLLHSGYLLKGLLSWAFGEDIAWGASRYGTPASIVGAWMQSPPHRENILSSRFEDVGVGVAWGTPSNGHGDGGFYTADFGYRRR
jgi:uncharacterized protein YkwD